MKHGKTNMAQTFPWGLFVRKGTRLLCADGKIRSVAYLAHTADTAFSVPCAIRIKGKYITGYATGQEQVWITGEKETDFKSAHVFRHHTGQTYNPLPDWPVTSDGNASARAMNTLIDSAQ